MKITPEIIGVILTALALLWTYFGAVINVKERLTKVETKLELFWGPLQDFLTQAIHHPNTPLLDKKLENFEELSLIELIGLKIDLSRKIEEMKVDAKDDPKILLYVLLMARLDLKIHDRKLQECKEFLPFYTKWWRKVLGRD